MYNNYTTQRTAQRNSDARAILRPSPTSKTAPSRLRSAPRSWPPRLPRWPRRSSAAWPSGPHLRPATASPGNKPSPSKRGVTCVTTPPRTTPSRKCPRPPSRFGSPPFQRPPHGRTGRLALRRVAARIRTRCACASPISSPESTAPPQRHLAECARRRTRQLPARA